MSVSGVRKLMHKEWWGELTAELINSRQDWMFRKLADELPVLTEAIISIWDGTISEPKLASAIVKSLETFNKMGKRHGNAFTEPLTKSKQDLYLTDKSVHNTQINNINMADHFNSMTMDEITEYSRNGVVPARICQVVEVDDEEEIT